MKRQLEIRRKLFGLSIERMAFVLSMTTAQYRQLENDEAKIPTNTLKELAFLLNVPVRYLQEE